MADVMMEWIDELASNVAHGDLSTWTEFNFDNVSKDAQGYGMAEAPRGGLGHWIKIKDGKVAIIKQLFHQLGMRLLEITKEEWVLTNHH